MHPEPNRERVSELAEWLIDALASNSEQDQRAVPQNEHVRDVVRLNWMTATAPIEGRSCEAESECSVGEVPNWNAPMASRPVVGRDRDGHARELYAIAGEVEVMALA